MHFKSKFLPLVDWVRSSDIGITDDKATVASAVEKISRDFSCNTNEAITLLSLALPPESIEQLVDTEDERLTDASSGESAIIENLEKTNILAVVNSCLSSIKQRDKDIIMMR